MMVHLGQRVVLLVLQETDNVGMAGTQTAMLVYGGGPNKQAVEAYDGSSFLMIQL